MTIYGPSAEMVEWALRVEAATGLDDTAGYQCVAGEVFSPPKVRKARLILEAASRTINMKKTNKSLRSMIFVPGYMTKFLEKAKGFKADAVILDLEDSVPDAYKEDARKNIREFLDQGAYTQQVFVRVNDIGSGLLGKDLEAILHENVDGIMFTKTVDERDIDYFDKLLGQLEQDHGFPQGKFAMCPLIETGSAVLRAYQIATASPRVIALAFGGEDYLTDLDGLHKEHGTSPPGSAVPDRDCGSKRQDRRDRHAVPGGR